MFYKNVSSENNLGNHVFQFPYFPKGEAETWRGGEGRGAVTSETTKMT